MNAAASTTQAEEEAAAWFARLNTLSIPSQALEEFQSWRRIPENDAAYERIEAVWAGAGRLTHHPDTARGVREALSRGRPADRFWRLRAPKARLALAGLALAATAVVVVTVLINRGEDYQTGVGEQRLVSLEDGSRVRLDTDTKLRVAMTETRRGVSLVHGQAFFDVAHDASRPFVVQADDVAVRALGTRFDVRRVEDQVRVTLVEGKVEVTDRRADKNWRLAPGQRFGSEAGVERTPQPVDLTEATSWTTGLLIFRDTPLNQAAAEVNRYSQQKVLVDAPEIEKMPVNGVFEAGDTQAFAAAVGGLFQLRVETSKTEIRLSRRD